TQWTVFYLRAADATDAAQMLGRLFPSSSVTATASSSSGSFFGDFTGGISAMSRGLADATGLSDLGTGPQTLRILPEPRSNAIFVTGPPHQVQQVEDVLRILDASELPGNLRDRAPRYIMVEYGDAAEIAQIVKDVYKP